MQVVVPVKRFADAKQRLAPLASGAERAALARAMAEHVLTELASLSSLAGVLLVSSEETICGFARRLGFDVMADHPAGLNAALGLAVAALPARRAADIAIVHADLPLFRAEDFAAIAARHVSGAARKMTIVTDMQGEGTNVRFCRPGLAVPPLYGARSAAAHEQAARNAGLEVEIVRHDGLSLDCDTPADLHRIMMRGGLAAPLSEMFLPFLAAQAQRGMTRSDA